MRLRLRGGTSGAQIEDAQGRVQKRDRARGVCFVVWCQQVSANCRAGPRGPLETKTSEAGEVGGWMGWQEAQGEQELQQRGRSLLIALV